MKAIKNYSIKLMREEVEQLKAIIGKGSHNSHTFRTAYVLLNCDEGEYSEKAANEQISKVLKIGIRTKDRVKKRFVEEGPEGVMERKPTSREYEKKIDGEVEAKLVRLCAASPRQAIQSGLYVCWPAKW